MITDPIIVKGLIITGCALFIAWVAMKVAPISRFFSWPLAVFVALAIWYAGAKSNAKFAAGVAPANTVEEVRQ